jgi:methionyl-tRNA formyltransferase
MMRKKITYIILSEKSWNKDLVKNLSKKNDNINWAFINEREDFNIRKLESIMPDKIFIPHWSYIIPDEIFEKYECVVFHMTDLPYGRGGSPLQNLILLGKEKTKISALKVVKELDAGPIYLKKDLNLDGTAEEIFIRANSIIKLMIIEILEKNLEPKEQKGNVVHFKRRKPKDSNLVDLNELKDIYDHIRMLDADGYPKAFIESKYFKFEFSNASLKKGEEIKAEIKIIKK